MKYQNEIWIADLNPQIGTETGKIRPVVVVQSDLLNRHGHTSTIVCPITTKLKNAPLIRISILSGESGLLENSEIMVDQIRTIDNSRFIKRLGKLNPSQQKLLKEYLKANLDLE